MHRVLLIKRILSSLSVVGLAFGCSVASAFSAQTGALDTSFDAQISENGAVYVITPQLDGKILIGGAFESVADVPMANIARLNADGTLDRSFDPGTAADVGFVTAIAVDQNGRILVGGTFNSSVYSNPANLARLNEDGSVDSSFNPFLYIDGPVNAVAVPDEDHIVVAGGFTYVEGYLRRNVVRLFQDGTLDYAFDACVASTAGVGASALAILEDGHILVTGKFEFTQNRRRDGIAKLESCGDLDPTYGPQPGINTNADVFCLALLDGQQAVMGGNFYLYHNLSRAGVVELDTNGVPIVGFDPGLGFEGQTVYSIAVQTNQKIVLGGAFASYNGTPVSNILRLNQDGSLDTTFNPGTGANNSISAIYQLPDQRFLVAGKFTAFNGVIRYGLVRLHGDVADGKLGLPFYLPSGEWRISFQGEEGNYYTIQTSSNLVDWSSFVKFTAPATPIRIVDPETNSLPLRFYRAISGP